MEHSPPPLLVAASESPAESLGWTGERFIPELSGSIAEEHLHRYAIASSLTTGMSVLDIASGEGYGSAILAQSALSVTGVEIDESTVKHASAKYCRSNLKFIVGDALSIPARDKEFDAVVSFETIEHVPDHLQFLQELTRVLKPNGLLILSSPEKQHYTDISGHQNPFHVHELYAEEFRQLLLKQFINVAILDQRVSKGSLILPEDGSVHITRLGVARGTANGLQFTPGVPDAIYKLAICSNGQLPCIPCGIFEHGPLNVAPFPNPYFVVEEEKLTEAAKHVALLERAKLARRFSDQQIVRKLDQLSGILRLPLQESRQTFVILNILFVSLIEDLLAYSVAAPAGQKVQSNTSSASSLQQLLSAEVSKLGSFSSSPDQKNWNECLIRILSTLCDHPSTDKGTESFNKGQIRAKLTKTLGRMRDRHRKEYSLPKRWLPATFSKQLTFHRHGNVAIAQLFDLVRKSH